MWDILEVIEGDCKGKFVIQSFMGGFVNNDGEVCFFDTPREAQDYLDTVVDELNQLVASLNK